ncbi:MAG TPA: LysM peptidoglycan-binding domain-containing protein [Chitinophagaceae bacterium]|nr:LysM peptidoglycan-binding domain-containing protein [Chitinophagaceae bacterium]
MKIRSIIAVLFLTCSIFVKAQDAELVVQGTSPKLYLVHTVAAKETWYSVGRLYNISPKELAPFNGLKMDAPLNIGQTLKIPLVTSNFSQTGGKASGEVLVPVYHVVQEKEWMYRISQNHNKVPVEKLEQWNRITNDELKAGMKLVIGYLKVKEGQSTLASRKISVTSQPPVAVNKPENKPVPPAVKEDNTETVNRTEPVARTDNKPQQTENRPVVNRSLDYNGGYFRSQFSNLGKSTAGTAGVFKSTSGWQDGKYYALMNNVPVGTIIKVDHPVTRKSVYAKVLGQLPEMKESSGLAIRLSDAAAAELGAGAYKFNVSCEW